MSSTQASRSKMEEQSDYETKPQSPLATFHKDFDSFKRAVDRAIERDPYGTLFGRRLQSPPTNNNSSWTSFSWIFDPQEIKEDRVSETKPPVPQSKPTPESPPASEAAVRDLHQSVMESRIPTSQSAATEEYEYDPISMRKVPKQKIESQVTTQEKPKPPQFEPPIRPLKPKVKTPEPPRKTFFETLFGEHGVDVPVKTYKPPKVYGYCAADKTEKSSDKKPTKTFGFETSRKHEFIALKAATLGNTIDTTAEYGGKYTQKDEAPNPEHPPQPRARDETVPPDDAPLFSGTTYEGKSDQILRQAQQSSEWLRKEGFGTQGTPSEGSKAVDIPVKRFRTKLESSLDRTQRQSQVQDAQPSKSEMESTRTTKVTASKSAAEKKTSLRQSIDEDSEDLDFLRASDVRAATKSARVSKQETEEQKTHVRNKLEDDFLARHTPVSDERATSDWGRSRISKSLDNIRKHVQDYPDGIVARTVKSMGIFNDNWKNYARPEPRVDLHKPLEFTDESLSSLPSIHKPKRKTASSISFIPSKEVIDAERLSKERTRTLQKATAMSQSLEEADAVKAKKLAKELRNEYESQYGRIDAQHRQVKSEQRQTSTDTGSRPTSTSHPLSTASVKEGVERHPAIEPHIGTFEPQYSKLVEEAKDIRRVLFDVQTHYRFLKTRWPTPETTTVKEENANAMSADGQKAASKIAAVSESKPTLIPEPVSTPEASPIWNDEQPPPVVELKEAFTAPFVILKYNRDSNEVVRLTAHFHEAGTQESPSPLKILARLHHQEKFFPYFSALEQNGYEILSSDQDTLIFHKISDTEFVKQPRQDTQSRITVEDAIAQPVIQEIAERPVQDPGVTPPPKDAATVLDEIPIEVEPIPGPSAPTAPPTTPTTAPPTTPTSKPATKPPPTPSPTPIVKRQEEVFSGTRTTRTQPITQTVNPIDPETSGPRSPSPHVEQHDTDSGVTGFRRFLRTLNRIFLTTLTIGVGAYVVGVITEGLDAKAQQKGIVAGTNSEAGPRKKIVMTGQRPGIFSTESSR